MKSAVSQLIALMTNKWLSDDDVAVIEKAIHELERLRVENTRERYVSDKLAGTLAETHSNLRWNMGCTCNSETACDVDNVLLIYRNARYRDNL